MARRSRHRHQHERRHGRRVRLRTSARLRTTWPASADRPADGLLARVSRPAQPRGLPPGVGGHARRTGRGIGLARVPARSRARACACTVLRATRARRVWRPRADPAHIPQPRAGDADLADIRDAVARVVLGGLRRPHTACCRRSRAAERGSARTGRRRPSSRSRSRSTGCPACAARFFSVMRNGKTCTWMRSCPRVSAASLSAKISSITPLVMAKQPVDVQPPCTRM